MDRTRLRLLVLVIVHVAATILLDQYADYGFVAFLLGCLSFSQMNLLGIGLVFGTWRRFWRVGSVVLADAALVLWQWYGQAVFFGGLLGTMGYELSVAAGLLVARYGPPKLRLIDLGDNVFPSTRFQFSLRQVMTLFVVVAVTLSAAKPIRAYISSAAENPAAFPTIVLLVISLVFLSGVVVSWAAMWATLGTTGTWMKSTLVIMLALAIGSLFTYCIAPLFPDYVTQYYLPTLFMSESIFTMASLLVVRACGYRLVGRKEMAT